MVTELINANPVIHEKKERRIREALENIDENAAEVIDQLEIFDHIRDIKDPEHPYSLEDLNVVTEDSVDISDELSHVRVTFTPTVEHCSMATIIGLCLRVKLMRSLPPRYKVDIRVAPGSHATEAAVNKQLNDKERRRGCAGEFKPAGHSRGVLVTNARLRPEHNWKPVCLDTQTRADYTRPSSILLL